MNKTIRILATFAFISLAAISSHAQTAPKILVVDLIKIFDGHWKTQEQVAKIHGDQVKAQDQASLLQKDGNALVAQFKELEEQAKNPTATAEAKAKAQSDAQKKYDEIQQKRTELNTFVQNTQSTLRQRAETFKTLLIEEISKVAVEIAKKKGATFLLDKSGQSMVGVSNVLYFDPSLEITDEVSAEMNKDRPAGATAPVSSATSPDTSPSITVPGVAPAK